MFTRWSCHFFQFLTVCVGKLEAESILTGKIPDTIFWSDTLTLDFIFARVFTASTTKEFLSALKCVRRNSYLFGLPLPSLLHRLFITNSFTFACRVLFFTLTLSRFLFTQRYRLYQIRIQLRTAWANVLLRCYYKGHTYNGKIICFC